jgi:anti-anti-sigma factor
VDPRLLHVRGLDTDVAGVVTVRGEVDMANAEKLRRAIATEMREATIAGRVGVVVDLSAVTFLDSSGLAVLIAAHHTPEVRLRLVVASHAVKRVLEISGMDQTLELHPSLDAALAANR